jgi:hypothetical protein
MDIKQEYELSLILPTYTYSVCTARHPISRNLLRGVSVGAFIGRLPIHYGTSFSLPNWRLSELTLQVRIIIKGGVWRNTGKLPEILEWDDS